MCLRHAFHVQVEPNVHKIEEHKKKYERLRKERDMKKADAERKRKHAEEVITFPNG
jgi:suppressor of tumorigenicity protein 13